jgi:hypothetical protein
MKNLIVNDYVNNYLGTQELACKYNLHRATIQRYLIGAGIQLRKRTSRIRVNNFYFSKYNKENCYWAGFILADGYIRTNKRYTLEIKLQKQDVDHLNKFKKTIEYEGTVFERKEYYSITISSPQIIKDLQNNFEIYNKKSLTCGISNKIPKKYLRDYICGYFDGDGCVSYTTTDTISFLGTEKTVDFIRKYFFEVVKIKLRSKDMPDITYNQNICAIFYYGKSAFKCLKYLYDKSTVYLNRKYNKYNCLIEKYN